MSDYVVSAVINLRDNFTKVLKNSSNALDRFNDKVNKAENIFGDRFNKINEGATKTLGNLKKMGTVTIGAGVTVGAGLYKAFDAHLALNDQLTRNRALSGLLKNDYADLEKQVKHLGKTTQFSPLDVAKTQKYQHMAGYNKSQVLELTPKLLKLSNISGEDTAKVSDIVTDSLSAFGLDVNKDSTQYLDVMSNLASKTNTDLLMLGDAFRYIAPSATALGEDYKEVAVMLGMLADNGIKASQAGAGLNTIMTRLSNAKSNKKMMEMFKLTNTKLYRRNKEGVVEGIPLREVIMGSKEALSKLSVEQRNQWLSTVAGAEGLKIWTAIMNSSVVSTKKAEDAVYNATGALDRMNDTIRESDKTAVDELKSAFEGLKIQLGEAVAPKMLDGIKKLTGYLNGLSDSGNINSTNINRIFDNMKNKATEVLGWITGSKALYHALAFGLTGNPYHLLQAGLNAGIAGGVVGTKLGKSVGEAYGKLVNEEKKKSLDFGLQRHGDIFKEQRFNTPDGMIKDTLFKENNSFKSYVMPDNGLKVPTKKEVKEQQQNPLKQEVNITFTGNINANSKDDVDRMALLLAQKLKDGVLQ
ncbi:MAG: phage tail tape measure protein [Cetobacterium sp.]|uniref:phage tail tape measure protein n=1 Tax=Cetobacterium sp. TaxID=2071632 RepID=UPI003F346DF6